MDDLRWTSVFLNGWKSYFSSVKKSKSDKKKDVKNGQLADVKKRMKNWFKLHPFFLSKKWLNWSSEQSACVKGALLRHKNYVSVQRIFFLSVIRALGQLVSWMLILRQSRQLSQTGELCWLHRPCSHYIFCRTELSVWQLDLSQCTDVTALTCIMDLKGTAGHLLDTLVTYTSIQIDIRS